MLQPYKAFCHGFCEKITQKPRQSLASLLRNAAQEQALKVKPMLG